MSDFWDFLKSRLLGPASVEVSTEDLSAFVDKQKAQRLALYELVLQSGINIIANMLSKCEFRTFLDWKEVYGTEYYLWNYSPNRNENASQFIHRLVQTVLRKGECLVVFGAGGELLIADSFTRERYALYSDVFRDVTVGGTSPYTFQRSFRAEEVLYYCLNNENLSTLLTQLEAEYTQLFEDAVKKFRKGGGERGILTIDANMSTRTFGTKEDGTPRTFNDVYREMMEKQFKSYFGSPNAVMPLWNGFSYDTKGSDASKKSTSDVKDITELRDQVYDAVSTALHIPPALLKGTVADTSELNKNLLSVAVDPLAKMIERENNRTRSGTAVLHGTYMIVDTTRAQHIDVFSMASNIDKLRAASVLNVDEVRRKVGEPEIREPWSRSYARTKNYEEISGEGNT